MSEEKCVYDYANKCDCSEDDKCGCTYPNNMPHDFDCEQIYDEKNIDSHVVEVDDSDTSPLLLGKYAPDFTAEAVLADNSLKSDFNLYEQLEGSYGYIFFYPADFTFVCPSELLAYNQMLPEFSSRHVKLIAISVDSVYAHQTWKKIPLQNGGIGDIQIPMVSDITKNISYQYGALKGDGTAMRASFIIDKKMVVRHQSAHDDKIGRDPREALRIIDALQFVESHGDLCPAGWRQGDKSLRPTAEDLSALYQSFSQQEQ